MKATKILRGKQTLAAIVVIMLFATSAKGEDVFLPCPAGILDSTDDIESGLDSTKDGGTLYLGPCTYYLTRTVEARWNHHGALQGQGKDLTFIKILPGAKIDGKPIAAWDGLRFSTLFLFENPESGDITISDLSIVVTDPEPAGYQDFNDFWQNALYNLIVVTGPDVNTSYENVRFRGAPGNFYDLFNVAHASHIFNFPYMAGNTSITDCDFTDMAVTIDTINLFGSVINISGNTFENVSNGPWIEACSDCTIKIEQNSMKQIHRDGLTVEGFGALIPSTYFVHKNTLETSRYGIFINGPLQSGVISKNKITLDSSGYAYAGLFAYDTSDILITNNRIDGIGFAGILAEGSSNGTIIGNNLQKFTLLPDSQARITLWDSWDFVVVGGSNKTNVAWTGGGGHIFTGVDNKQYRDLGQDIKDAMRMKKEIFRSMP